MQYPLIFSSILLSLIFGQSIFAENKIGVMNVNKVFIESPQVSAAKADFRRKFDFREHELSQVQKNFQREVEFFNKNSILMKLDTQRNEQQKLLEKQKKIQEMQAKLQADAGKAQQEAFDNFSRKLEMAVNKVAVDKKLDLVLVNASLAYSKKELDITHDIVKQMRKM